MKNPALLFRILFFGLFFQSVSRTLSDDTGSFHDVVSLFTDTAIGSISIILNRSKTRLKMAILF